ncbi:MAG: DNA internalization-related competence protein ComEC/Rec2 [Bacillota bacterium]|nr:DNA internalization-related competence protein ComEC/Rec2 [Bacillota bacterium]
MTLPLFTAGFAAALLAGVYLPVSGWNLYAGLGLLAVWLGLTLLKRGKQPRQVLLGVALALLWLTAWGAVFQAPAEALANRTVRLQAVVEDWPEATDYGLRIPVRAGEEDGRKVKALFYGDADLAGLRPGDTLSCVAYCTPADRVRGEESLYYPSRGILLQMQSYGEVTVTKAEGIPPRYALTLLAGSIRDRIDGLYPADQAAFLKALLTGDKSGLSDSLTHSFNRVGLGHVVVISGLHVSFLLGLLSFFLKPKGKGSLLVLLTVLIAFSVMTGNAPGTVRAVVLGGVVLLGQYLGRDSHPMIALSLGLLILLTVNPYAIANAGLQFSFLATAGIFLFGRPWLARWLQGLPKRHRKRAAPLLGLLAVSLGAMVLTVPLSALYFGRFSLIAPLSNLLTSWAVSLAFAGGMVSLLLGGLFLPLGQAAAVVVGVPIRFVLWYAEKAGRLSLAALTMDSGYFALWAGFVYLILCLYLLVPVKGERPVIPVCACVVTLCLSFFLTVQTVRRADLTVTVLDVGQGQSVVLTSGNTTALVDCGGTKNPGDTAAGYLQSVGKGTLDLLVLTHFHADHAGGVPELMGRVRVKAMALPDVDRDSPLRREIEALAQAQGTEIHYITETTRTDLEKAVLTLHPPLSGNKEVNEQCLTLVCTSGDWDALITGDMPGTEEQRLAARGVLPDAELLVVGHHGSKTSTSQALLEAVSPAWAVISVGYNNYGHPAQETLDRLSALDITCYRTDQTGSVTLYANRQEDG